jgi:hypothetical protein
MFIVVGTDVKLALNLACLSIPLDLSYYFL